ncbi:MAG: class I SAM-dependent methyltransferase [Promethearchaeota archaeon]
MNDYYTDKLSAERLKQCYEIAPPRVQQYLHAELSHVLQKTRPGDIVLDLGCGYGRIIPHLTQKAGQVIGIDTSLNNLLLGRQMLHAISNCHLLNMDAVHLAFPDQVFDLVACIQNGISAFHVDQHTLIRESIRVTKPGGKVLFSSYSDKFWQPRLKWFQLQAEAGLLGEIDYKKTGNGVIVCKDGFRATTIRPKQFLSITRKLDLKAEIVEVDESSIFCEIDPP